MSFLKTNSKYWVFRIANPASDQSPTEWPDTEWIVWQKEKGEGGLIHHQGYVVFQQKKRGAWVKRHCDDGAHWEGRNGTHDQARHYSTKPNPGCECKHCTDNKDGRIAGPWFHGVEPVAEQGKRNDLLSLKRRLDEGATERDIATSNDSFPVWAKYGQVVQRYKRLTMPQRDWLTEVTVYWGEPGIGKTSRARHEAGPDAFWLSKPGGQTTWWDDYDGQECVVIDEFYGWIARDLMCRICDRYPLNVETKGGSTRFLAKRIIITSNLHPQYWWPRVGLGAMSRRLEAPMGKTIEMVEPWTAPAVVALVDAALAARIEEQLSLATEEPELTPENIEEATGYLDVNPGFQDLSVSGQGWINWDE